MKHCQTECQRSAGAFVYDEYKINDFLFLIIDILTS